MTEPRMRADLESMPAYKAGAVPAEIPGKKSYKISANDGKYISHKKINNDLSRAPIIVDNKMLILNRSSELIIIN